MKNTKTALLFTIIGFGLLAAGLLIIKSLSDTTGFFAVVAYVLIGVGCGIFGHGVGSLISNRALKTDPKLARQQRIEAKDERNRAISHAAKAKAYDIMLPVYGALLLAFALMNADLAVILLLIAAYLFICGYSIYYRIKFSKEY